MNDTIKEKIGEIVDGKLNDQELGELITFFRDAFKENIDPDETDERFFKDLAFEMSASAKELALLIIDYRKDMKLKIHPGITDLTTVYIPEAADQLEGIIETTETVANKIMDNLEIMQDNAEKMTGITADLNKGEIVLPGQDQGVAEVRIDDETRQRIQSLIDFMEKRAKDEMTIITEIYTQMSFQDLTGQRIKRIMSLVQQMEERLKKMVVSFGIKIAEKEKNPDITEIELAQAVAEKETELSGPQKAGCGLDQAGIDDLLASI